MITFSSYCTKTRIMQSYPLMISFLLVFLFFPLFISIYFHFVPPCPVCQDCLTSYVVLSYFQIHSWSYENICIELKTQSKPDFERIRHENIFYWRIHPFRSVEKKIYCCVLSLIASSIWVKMSKQGDVMLS